MPTPEQSKRGGFPWGRAFRIGAITALAIAAFVLAGFASVDGADREDLAISAFAALFIAPLAIAVAAVVLRFRRELGDWEVAVIAALAIIGALSLFGLVGYFALHMYRPG